MCGSNMGRNGGGAPSAASHARCTTIARNGCGGIWTQCSTRLCCMHVRRGSRVPNMAYGKCGCRGPSRRVGSPSDQGIVPPPLGSEDRTRCHPLLEVVVLLGNTLPADTDHDGSQEAAPPSGQASQLLPLPYLQCASRITQWPHRKDQADRPRLSQPRELQNCYLLPLRCTRPLSRYPRKSLKSLNSDSAFCVQSPSPSRIIRGVSVCGAAARARSKTGMLNAERRTQSEN